MAELSDAQQRLLDGIDMSEGGAYDIPSYSTMRHTTARALEALGKVTVVRMPAGAIRVRRRYDGGPEEDYDKRVAEARHEVAEADEALRAASILKTEATNASAAAHQRLSDALYERRVSTQPKILVPVLEPGTFLGKRIEQITPGVYLIPDSLVLEAGHLDTDWVKPALEQSMLGVIESVEYHYDQRAHIVKVQL